MGRLTYLQADRQYRPGPGAMVSEINGKRPQAERTPSRSPIRKQLTVLVADDETYIVDFVSILLEDEGFRVIRAYDGEQAWRLAQSEHPDLLISDVMMPRLSGLELLHRIRSSQNGLASTPVILMSAVVRDAPTVDAAFLPKPFDIERMLDAVSDQLDIAL